MIKVEVKACKNCQFPSKRIKKVARDHLRHRGIDKAEVEIEMISPSKMAALNKKYRRRVGPTDVLSFSLPKIFPTDDLLGTIVLCHDIISENSKKYSVHFDFEMEKVIRHGIDHLIGIHHR